MIKFTITFAFDKTFQFATFNSDQLAFALLEHAGEELFDLYNENSELDPTYEFYHGGKKYGIEFSYRDPQYLNIYSMDEETDGNIIERDVPYILVKAVNELDETIYSLSELV